MNKFNALHGDEPNEPPREWNSQPTSDHFKYRTYSSKINLVISAIMGRLNHHAIDNDDVKIPTSENPVESISESVPDPYTTSIKSIADDIMVHLLKLFHSEHDKYLLDVDLHMLQA